MRSLSLLFLLVFHCGPARAGGETPPPPRSAAASPSPATPLTPATAQTAPLLVLNARTSDGPATPWTRYQSDLGFPAAQVRGIVRDQLGFMWFATMDGLVRFDGHECRIFRHDAKISQSLADDRLQDLQIDRLGRLWIACEVGLDYWDPLAERFVHAWRSQGSAQTSDRSLRKIILNPDGTIWLAVRGQGLVLFDPATGGAHTVAFHDAGALKDAVRRIVTIQRDHRGRVWIGTDQRGLHRYDPANGEVRSWTTLPGAGGASGDTVIDTLLEDRRGQLWIGTVNGLFRLDPATGALVRFEFGNTDPSADHIQCLMLDGNGSVWIGGDGGGLLRYDPGFDAFVRFRNAESDPRSLLADKAWILYEDPLGDIWAGHHPSGISHLNRLQLNFRSVRRLPGRTQTLSHPSVLCFLEGPDGALWIGTDGGGIDRWNETSGTWTNLHHDPANPASLSSNAVLSLVLDRKGFVWAGTWNGGANRLDPATGVFHHFLPEPGRPESISHRHIWRLLEDRGRIWLSAFDGGLNRTLPDRDGFEKFVPIKGDPTSINHERSWCMLVTRDGTFFAGTHGGLAQYDEGSGKWRQYRHRADDPQSLSHDGVIELLETRDKAIWVGTHGGGLNRLDRSTGTFRRYGRAQGLPNDVVCGLLEDSLGRLWISTFNGLCRLDPATGKTRIYDERDGLPSRNFNRGARLLRADGEMLFGSVDGFVRFHPEKVIPDTSRLSVVITRFEVFNQLQEPGAPRSPLTQSINHTNRIELPARRSSVIGFQFAALGYRSPLGIRFEYRMEGFDRDWQAAGPERRATYTNLDPGTYRFRIRATNREGATFLNGDGLVLVIAPAWWQTLWFRILAIGALLGAAWLVGYAVSMRRTRARIRAMEHERALAEERQRGLEERGKLQSQLLQAQKMESVGRLAGGVAHDFNNMLQAIMGNASLAMDEAPPGGPVREHLEEIQRAARRSADLTRQLLAFARKQTISPRVLDLNETIGGMLKMLQRLIGENIQLVWNPGPGLWFVSIDPSQVDQMLANLVVNARDAIRGSGQITIRTANTRIDETQAAMLHNARTGDYVLISVSDTGCGLDEEVKAHLFEPFFTTKKNGEGTGLGLATVYGIVSQNGGQIKVYSEQGQGAVFKIYLPRVEAASADALTPEETVDATGDETILFVEDEELIQNIGRRILESQGYRVFAAGRPEEALRLASEFREPIHLLITDVVMPGMNGRELAERVLALHPETRLLYISGYTDDVIAHHGVLAPGLRLLQKPFSRQVLTRTVREVLDGGPQV